MWQLSMMAYALRDKVEQLGLVEVRMALDLQHGWADAGVGNDVINLRRGFKCKCHTTAFK